MDTELELTTPTAHERAQPDGSDIRVMSRAETAAVASALADAFYDDPLMSWVVRDDAVRRERLQVGFTFYLERIWLQHEAVYTHERHVGAAVWLPPERWHLGPIAQLQLLPGLVRRARGDLPRLIRLTTFMEKRHPEEPHWYLPVIGVASNWQGRGFGAALMRPVLDRCDAERLPAYLEATSSRSRELYARVGFEVLEECRVADDAPPFWRMWREPKNPMS